MIIIIIFNYSLHICPTHKWLQPSYIIYQWNFLLQRRSLQKTVSNQNTQPRSLNWYMYKAIKDPQLTPREQRTLWKWRHKDCESQRIANFSVRLCLLGNYMNKISPAWLFKHKLNNDDIITQANMNGDRWWNLHPIQGTVNNWEVLIVRETDFPRQEHSYLLSSTSWSAIRIFICQDMMWKLNRLYLYIYEYICVCVCLYTHKNNINMCMW